MSTCLGHLLKYHMRVALARKTAVPTAAAAGTTGKESVD